LPEPDPERDSGSYGFDLTKTVIATAVHEFMKVCYENGFVQPFDWGVWAKEARRYMGDPALVGTARLATCIKLITARLRAERFCDGHLEEVLVEDCII
jgi:hypothetical protein